MGEPGHAPQTAPFVAPSPLLSEDFAAERVTELRHILAARLQADGLVDQLLDDFVLAVNELLTNVVRHGGGTGRVQLWRDGPTVVCEVSDRGPGLGPEHLDRHDRPAPGTVGGWGLWLADRLSDSMAVWTGPAGTTVRLTATLQQVSPATDPIE